MNENIRNTLCVCVKYTRLVRRKRIVTGKNGKK